MPASAGWSRIAALHKSDPQKLTAAAGPTTAAVELVISTPDWLQCTTGFYIYGAGWMAADRPVCAILHLVGSV